nr:hypothetical protein [Candidatus Sigynarchaeota archaeon]
MLETPKTRNMGETPPKQTPSDTIVAHDTKLIFFANAVLPGLCKLMDCEVMGDNTSESKRFSFKSPMGAAVKPFQDSWRGSRPVAHADGWEVPNSSYEKEGGLLPF